MSYKGFWKKNAMLSAYLSLSLFTFAILGQEKPANENQVKPCKQPHETENGIGIAKDNAYPSKSFINENPFKKLSLETKPLQITYKPIAKYTDEARKNCIEGKVYLKITFFANGRVGNLKVVEGLDYGLTEQAIAAAKLIRFEPALKNKKAITVTKTLSFNFTIY